MNTPTIIAPRTEPMIDPRPPNSEVPPITTAVIEARFTVSKAMGETDPTRPMAIQAAKPQITPATV